MRLALVLAMALASACARRAPLPVAPEVDLARYAGDWFEIASFPTRFQHGCACTRATYTLQPDGTVAVRNTCRDGAAGPLRSITGTATVPDPATPAKLRVVFVWPFRGDYWILAVDRDYRWAIVGHPSREYLWFLSREPAMPDALYAELASRAAALGFDVGRLRRTVQGDGCDSPAR